MHRDKRCTHVSKRFFTHMIGLCVDVYYSGIDSNMEKSWVSNTLGSLHAFPCQFIKQHNITMN